MEKKKRLVSALLVMITFLQVISPTFSFAKSNSTSNFLTRQLVSNENNVDDKFEYDVDDDGVIINKYLGNENEILIPETIKGKNVIKINGWAFSGKEVEKIVLPKSLRRIGPMAFYNTKLKNIDLPNNIEKIGDGAFQDTNISYIKIPKSLKYASGMLSGMKKLSKVEFEGGEVRLLKGLFRDSNLTYFEIPEGIEEIPESTFSGSDLENIKLPNSLKKIGILAFYNTKLSNIKLPNNIEYVGESAFGNTNLKSINIPKSLKKAYGMLSGIEGLQNVEFEENQFKILKGMFKNSSIKHLDIPEGVEEIPENAFNNSKLESIKLPSTLKKIGVLAFSSTNLKEIQLPNNLTSIGSSAFYFSKLENVTLPNRLEYVGDGAFSHTNLKRINIPKSLKSGKGMLSEIEGIEEVEFEDGKIRLLNGLFSGSYIKNFNIPEGIEEIPENTFNNSKLESIKLPSTLKKIGVLAFSSTNLKEIQLPNNLTSIGSSAFYFSKLENVTLPKNLVYVGDGAFSNTNLISLNIPKSLKEGDGMLSGIKHLKEIKFDEGFTNFVKGLFKGSNIRKVEIPEGITVIPDFLFSDSKLEEISLPNTLNTIGAYSFDSTKIKEINLPENLKNIREGAFSSTKIKKIKLPQKIKYVGFGAFSNSEISEINIPKSLEEGRSMLYGMKKLDNILVEEGTTEILNGLFDSVKIEKLILPKGVNKINVYSFDNAEIDELILPNTVNEVEEGAFNSFKCKKLQFESEKIKFHSNWNKNSSLTPYVYLNSDLYRYFVKNNFKVQTIDSGNESVIDKSKTSISIDNSKIKSGELNFFIKYKIDKKDINNSKLKIYFNNSKIKNISDGENQLKYVSKDDGIIIDLDKLEGEIKLSLLSNNSIDNEVNIFASLEYNINEKVIVENIGELKANYSFLTSEIFEDITNNELIIKGYSNKDRNLKLFLDEKEITSISVDENSNYKYKFKYDIFEKNREYKFKIVSSKDNGLYLYNHFSFIRNDKSPKLLEFKIKHGEKIYDMFNNMEPIRVNPFSNFNIFAKYNNLDKIDKVFLHYYLDGKKFDLELEYFKDKGYFEYSGILPGINRSTFPNNFTLSYILKNKLNEIDYKDLESELENDRKSNSKIEELIKEKISTKKDGVILIETDGYKTEIESKNVKDLNLTSYKKLSDITKGKLKGIPTNVNSALDKVYFNSNFVFEDKNTGKKTIYSFDEVDKVIIGIGNMNVVGGNGSKNSIRFYQESNFYYKDDGKLIRTRTTVSDPVMDEIKNTLRELPINYISDKSEIFGTFADFAKGGAAYAKSGQDIVDLLKAAYKISNSNLPSSEKDMALNKIGLGIALSFSRPSVVGLGIMGGMIGATPLGIALGVASILFERYIDNFINNLLNKINGGQSFKNDYLLDPSGIVFNSRSKEPVKNAKIILYYKDKDGNEKQWDAEKFYQKNPIYTLEDGKFEWYVKAGIWKVKASKHGYYDSETDWITVPPAVTDLNINLNPIAYKMKYDLVDGYLKESKEVYYTDINEKLPIPEKNGYEFEGWYLNSEYSGERIINTSQLQGGDVKLYAKWNKK